MSGLNKRILRENKGQSLVETVLILPMILLLFIGVLEFGRFFYSYLVITQGSREGARLAVVGAGNDDVVERVNEVTTTLDLTKLKVTISPGERERIRGTPVKVTVEYNLELLLPDFFNIFLKPFVISATTVMRME